MCFFILLLLILVTGCKKKDDNPTEPTTPQSESTIQVISTTGSGTLTTTSGYGVRVIQGAVPPNAQGSSASVTFSIESPVTPPKALPSTAQAKSEIFKVGPDGFSFRWPIKVVIPFKNAEANQVRAVYFDPLYDRWTVIPASKIDNTKKVMEVDVINLGFFAAATVSQGFSKTNADDMDGGFEMTGSTDYHYTLTVKSVSNFKYPYQAAWFTNLVGLTGSSGINPIGGSIQPTHIHLPQATYEIWITRTKPGTFTEAPKIYTYTIPANATISSPVTYTSALSSGTGWSSLPMPSGGEWKEGTPATWPKATNTYGTGDFQATLTWVNNTIKYSDVDLHLFGPNNIHVYWDSDKSSDGSIELDRDWQEEVGNAVENIYSLKQMPKGTYTIKVNLYSGKPTSFSVRVIRFGSVKTYNGTVTTVNGNDDSSLMLTLDSFTVN
jgi:hypothetical protein